MLSNMAIEDLADSNEHLNFNEETTFETRNSTIDDNTKG